MQKGNGELHLALVVGEQIERVLEQRRGFTGLIKKRLAINVIEAGVALINADAEFVNSGLGKDKWVAPDEGRNVLRSPLAGGIEKQVLALLQTGQGVAEQLAGLVVNRSAARKDDRVFTRHLGKLYRHQRHGVYGGSKTCRVLRLEPEMPMALAVQRDGVLVNEQSGHGGGPSICLERQAGC